MDNKGKNVLSLLTPDSDLHLWDVVLIFERKVLRKIYGPMRNELTGDYERRENINLELLYNKPNIKCFLLEWAGHVWRAKGSIIRKVLTNKPAGKRPRGRLRQQWQDRLNADIRIVNRKATIETSIDPDKWKGLIKLQQALMAHKAKENKLYWTQLKKTCDSTQNNKKGFLEQTETKWPLNLSFM